MTCPTLHCSIIFISATAKVWSFLFLSNLLHIHILHLIIDIAYFHICIWYSIICFRYMYFLIETMCSKYTTWHVRPSKTCINLRIHTVLSVFDGHSKGSQEFKVFVNWKTNTLIRFSNPQSDLIFTVRWCLFVPYDGCSLRFDHCLSLFKILTFYYIIVYLYPFVWFELYSFW